MVQHLEPSRSSDGPQPGAPVSFRQRALFLLSSIAVLVLLAMTRWDEARPRWLSTWHEARVLANDETSSPNRVPQIIVDPLNVVDRCTACHAAITDPVPTSAPQPLAAHPGPMLSLHEVDKIGCTPCHDGQGRATRIPAAHGEVSHWDRPLLRGANVQAGCPKCHNPASILRAPELRRGAELVAHYACDACHAPAAPSASPTPLHTGKARGAVGPELTFAADRLQPTWIAAWLTDPAKVLRGARMGNFGFDDQQRADLIAYLMTFTGKAELPDLAFPPDEASDDELDAIYERGKRVFRTARCLSCHAVDGNGGTIGVDLSRVGNKLTVTALDAWIEKPDRFHPGTRMPRFRLADEERHALAYFLSEEMRDPDLEDWLDELEGPLDRLLKSASPDNGHKLARSRGCLDCHRIEGETQMRSTGPDLSRFGEKTVDRLPFGEKWSGPRSRVAWTRAKLEKPRDLSADLLMPSYPLEAEDLDALLVSTLGRVTPAIDTMRADPLVQPIPRYPPGAVGALMRDLRCLTCHMLDGAGGSLAPDISFVGSRVQRDWLRDYLKTPYAIRPSLVERMPRFYLTDDEAQALSDYLFVARKRDALPQVPDDSASVERGAALYTEHRCAGCHMLGDQGGSIGPNLSNVGRRLQPAWIALQLLDPAVVGAAEPCLSLSEVESAALAAFLATQRLEDVVSGG